MPADDYLRKFLEEHTSAVEPSDEQREGARRDLYAAMQPEPVAARPWWRRTAVSWSAAAAVVVAAFVTFVLIVPTSTRAVDANLAEVAAAARTVDPVELPAGAYIYYRVESIVQDANEVSLGVRVSYRLSAREDLWVSGMSELRERTVAAPTFFSAADEEAYYASSLPESEGVGETRTVSLDGIPNENSLDGLSTDTARLWDQIIEELSVDDDFTKDNEVRILEHVAQLMNPRFNASPEMRGALLEVLGRLDVFTSKTPGGGVTLLLSYEDEFGAFEQTLEFDSEGYLVRDLLTLTDTFGPDQTPIGLVHDIRYSRPTVVAEPGVLPTP